MSASWRIFCAIELPADVRAHLQDHIRELREAVPDVAASWTRVENIHLTLKFFGNIAVDRLTAISSAASRTSRQFSSFQVGIAGTGVFPKPGRAQVLWIGVSDQAGKLSALQKSLQNEFALEGFPKEDRAFRPHLTIARIRRPEGARRLAETHLETEFKSHEIKVGELIVFRSELGSQGSKYTSISHHQLSDQLPR